MTSWRKLMPPTHLHGDQIVLGRKGTSAQVVGERSKSFFKTIEPVRCRHRRSRGSTKVIATQIRSHVRRNDDALGRMTFSTGC